MLAFDRVERAGEIIGGLDIEADLSSRTLAGRPVNVSS
jgi:hypothetical protein